MSWEWHPFTFAILCGLGSRHRFSSHSEEGEFTNVWPSRIGNHRKAFRVVHPRPPSGPESLTSLSQAKYIDVFPRFPRVLSHDSICSKSKNLNIPVRSRHGWPASGVVLLGQWWSEAKLASHQPCLLVFICLCNCPLVSVSKTSNSLLNNKIGQRWWNVITKIALHDKRLTG